jgi:hypothetical protein
MVLNGEIQTVAGITKSAKNLKKEVSNSKIEHYCHWKVLQ